MNFLKFILRSVTRWGVVGLFRVIIRLPENIWKAVLYVLRKIRDSLYSLMHKTVVPLYLKIKNHGFGFTILQLLYRSLQRSKRFPLTFLDMIYHAFFRVRDLARDDTKAPILFYRGGRSEHTLRNFLLALKEAQSGLRGTSAREAGAEPLPEDEKEVKVVLLLDGEYKLASHLYSAFSMLTYSRDFHVFYLEQDLAKKMPFLWSQKKRADLSAVEDASELKWGVDLDSFSETDLVNYFQTAQDMKISLLDLGLSRAWQVSKSHVLGYQLVATSLPNPQHKDIEELLTDWETFFAMAEREIPGVHFILLNSAPILYRDFMQSPPNVSFSGQFGLDFADRLEFIFRAGLYFGAFDVYGAAVAGLQIPALLLKPEASDGSTVGSSKGTGARSITPRPEQTLLLDDVPPGELISVFKQFIESQVAHVAA